MKTHLYLVPAFLLASAVLLRYWFAPLSERLTAIIKGALHVYNLTGDVNRTGQYFFPPHVQRIEYPLWNPMFVGLRQATFERIEQIEGLQVYVFSLSGSGMDENTGYSYLSDVPERYLAHTDGQGTLWIEPVSGVVVDYEEQGISYFVDRETGARLADVYEWSDRYTPETQTVQTRLARAARLRILLLEVWLPAVFLLAGLIWLSVGLLLNRKKKNIPGCSSVIQPVNRTRLPCRASLMDTLTKRAT